MSNLQQPAQGQVPDHRFGELQEQFRLLAEQNKQLRQTIDVMAYQRQPQQQAPPEAPLFEPKVDEALTKKFQQMLSPQQQEVQNKIGLLFDQNDDLRFRLQYGAEASQKYQDRINSIRQERSRMGQWVSREDAYKQVYFEEQSKKPQQKPVAAQGPAQPVFDPYLNRYVQADGSAVPSMTLEQAVAQDEGQNPQGTPVVQQNQNFQGTPPVQQQIQGIPQQAEPQLPPVGSVAPGVRGAPAGPTGVNMESSDQALSAWAQKYGDEPL